MSGNPFATGGSYEVGNAGDLIGKLCYELNQEEGVYACNDQFASPADAQGVCTGTYSADAENYGYTCSAFKGDDTTIVQSDGNDYFCENPDDAFFPMKLVSANVSDYDSFSDKYCEATLSTTAIVIIAVLTALLFILLGFFVCWVRKSYNPEQRKNRTRGTPPKFPETELADQKKTETV